MKGKLRCAFFAFVVDARLLLVCEEAGENNKYERKREGKIVNKRENEREEGRSCYSSLISLFASLLFFATPTKDPVELQADKLGQVGSGWSVFFHASLRQCCPVSGSSPTPSSQGWYPDSPSFSHPQQTDWKSVWSLSLKLRAASLQHKRHAESHKSSEDACGGVDILS